MNAGESTERSRWRGIAVLALVAALAVTFSWARLRYNQVYLPGALENVAGIDPRGAANPFQYRVLVPKLVRFVHEHVLPGAGPRRIFVAFDAAFLVGAFYALRRLARDLFGSEPAALATALGLFYVLPFHFLLSREYPFWYAWDMSSLLVFTYGLWLIRARQWGVYYPLFVLGTFNRETTCFLTCAHLFTAWRASRKATLLGHCAAQAALWLLAKAVLWQVYHRSPGADVYQSAVAENWESLRDPAMYRWYALAFGGLWLPLLVLGRRIAEPWIRSLLLVVPVFAAGMFFAGVWSELRIWGELTPIVLLATVAALRGQRTRAVSQHAPVA